MGEFIDNMSLLECLQKISESDRIFVSKLVGNKCVLPHAVIDMKIFIHEGNSFVYAIGGFDGVRFVVEYLPYGVSIRNLEEAS